jgi:hypothetical protein
MDSGRQAVWLSPTMSVEHQPSTLRTDTACHRPPPPRPRMWCRAQAMASDALSLGLDDVKHDGGGRTCSMSRCAAKARTGGTRRHLMRRIVVCASSLARGVEKLAIAISRQDAVHEWTGDMREPGGRVKPVTPVNRAASVPTRCLGMGPADPQWRSEIVWRLSGVKLRWRICWVPTTSCVGA